MDLLGSLEDDDYLRIGALPVVPFSEALLDRCPKASSADLCDAWHSLNPEPAVPKTEFKRVRDAWKERRTSVGTVAETEHEQAQQAVDARKNAWAQFEAAIASGNGKKMAELGKVIKALDDMAPERAEAADAGRWDLLTEAERDCMMALVAKMNGQALDEDGEWFVVLLSRVPDRPYDLHPAHIPLPEVDRPAMLTT